MSCRHYYTMAKNEESPTSRMSSAIRPRVQPAIDSRQDQHLHPRKVIGEQTVCDPLGCEETHRSTRKPGASPTDLNPFRETPSNRAGRPPCLISLCHRSVRGKSCSISSKKYCYFHVRRGI